MSSYFSDPVVPLTVFAPTNEAFQKLPKDVMEKIKTNVTFNGSKNIFLLTPMVTKSYLKDTSLLFMAPWTKVFQFYGDF